MSKKVYKITESQMRSILEGKKVSKKSDGTKTKYRISESQLKKIFSELESNSLKEYDNYNYPMGADSDPNAPWNDNSNTKPGEYVSGNFVGVGVDSDEMLLMDKSNKEYYFTYKDSIYDGNDDIYDILQDYLDVEQEEDEDEDGRYSTSASDWKDYITADDLLTALSSYMNYMAKKGMDLKVGDLDAFENGDVDFLRVTPESIDFIHSAKLKSMIK